GVNENQIEIIKDESEATDAALNKAATGDLVLILGDNIKRTWKQIIYFGSDRTTSDDLTPVVKTPPPDDVEEFRIDESLEIIRDERGVRIAREPEDSD
ncbi:MAG: cyanophycin synthetase, partial [Gammaproteobacteria bacterium]|nr:cyanophycin synthetase [Gammaproteobacteria bacterium]